MFVVNGTSGTWVETGTWATDGASMTTTNSKVIVSKTNQFFLDKKTTGDKTASSGKTQTKGMLTSMILRYFNY